MIFFTIKVLILLFAIGIFACVFAGGKSVVLALEWITAQVKKLIDR